MLATTSDLIKKYHLGAQKSLGQNFILDKNFTDKIVASAGDVKDSIVLEIGPGPGSLTRSILDAGAKKLIVVEKDQRCIALLNELKEFYGERLEIIEGDALEIDELKIISEIEKKILRQAQDDNGRNCHPEPDKNSRNCHPELVEGSFPNTIRKFKIIANLPYNVGTVLIFKWLKNCDKISSMTLMLQKEVVERITAKKGENHYGRLAVMVNFLCKTKMVFTVNKSVFTPPPKVTSAIVEIIPRENPLADVEFKKLEKLVAAAFNQRRKMLRSSLKAVFKNAEETLIEVGINPELRAENLEIEEFCKLAKKL